ncbi:MAG: photosynthetic reaction center subunit H [Pseudomonadota bacterium]
MEHIDWALIALYLFWAGFAYLVYYLQREGRREGFPLVADPSGKPLNQDIWMPAPKTFITNDGRTKVAPDPASADTRTFNAEFALGGAGSPLVPTGNPMKDGIGAGAWAERADVVDTTFEGHARVVPIRVASDFTVAEQDIDPRDANVYGADGALAGKVSDIWVDRSDFVIRYLEVELAGPVGEGATAQRVLVPWLFANIKTDRDRFQEFISMKKPKPNVEIHVSAILAEQFKDVPGLKDNGEITMLEEEKIQAYYGAGTLYATPERAEPIV